MPKKQLKDVSQWMMLINDELTEKSNDEENNPVFCKLRHPKYDSGAMFVFSHSDKKISEITQFQGEFGSWFIDQTVQQDGSLYMTTPVNPAFLILPYLIKEAQSGKYKPLEQVLVDSDYPECHRLCQCDNLQSLDDMCEVKGPDDLRAYKYSEEKALSWLRSRVERLSRRLEHSKAVVSGGARVATFVKSAKSETNKDDHIRYAHGLISEYLPEALALTLKTNMGIKDPVVSHDKPQIEEPKSKRAKTDNGSPTDDYSKGKSNSQPTLASKLSTAQKQLSKVDKSGMKSISSFFSPKANKANK